MRRNKNARKFLYAKPKMPRSKQGRRELYRVERAFIADNTRLTPKDIDAEVAKLLPHNCTNSALWVTGLLELKILCPTCQGSGRYQLRNAKWGKCYLCACKGFVTHKDLRRNEDYWQRRNAKTPAPAKPEPTPEPEKFIELEVQGKKVKLSEAKLTELLVNTLSA